MLQRTVLMALALALTASLALAQTAPKPAAGARATTARAAAHADQQPPPPAPPPPAAKAKAPPPPPPPPPAKPKGQPINVQVEIVITEHRGNGTPVKKTVSLLVADQRSGMIRSEAIVPGTPGSAVPLSVDASPEILEGGRIRLGLSVFYDLPRDDGSQPRSDAQPMRMSLRENASIILESGKSMLVTQSADPVGDRQVTVEVKATILK